MTFLMASQSYDERGMLRSTLERSILSASIGPACGNATRAGSATRSNLLIRRHEQAQPD
jgi:hypothetical protein